MLTNPSTPHLTARLHQRVVGPDQNHRKDIDMLYQNLFVPRFDNEPTGTRAMELYEIQRSINEVDSLHKARRQQRRANWLRRPDLKRAR